MRNNIVYMPLQSLSTPSAWLMVFFWIYWRFMINHFLAVFTNSVFILDIPIDVDLASCYFSRHCWFFILDRQMILFIWNFFLERFNDWFLLFNNVLKILFSICILLDCRFSLLHHHYIMIISFSAFWVFLVYIFIFWQHI